MRHNWSCAILDRLTLTAAQLGYSDIVQFLVNRGVNIDARLPSGSTALITASWYNRLAVVRILLDNGANVNVCGDFQRWPVLTVEYFGGYLELVHLIYMYDRNSNDKSETSNLDSAAADCTEIISTTVDQKYRNDETALRIACDQGGLKLVEVLLKNSNDVDIPDHRGWTPLMTAAGRGHVDIMLFLIQSGAHINRQNQYGATALQFACANGRLNSVQTLIHHGAAVDLVNNKGWSPLMLALQASDKQVGVLEHLLSMGANVDQKGPDGAAALHIASATGQLNAIYLFLDHGATIDLRNGNGDTPLMLAVVNNHRLVVRVLVERGARTDVVNRHGCTPVIIAREKDITALLLDQRY
ncbi:hypothetical protein PF004_g16954 [Phytophthora fragariae]|uniref:Uncharacterized protein n=1 Tax=Phytophthora fragariae TaxID=53985 RepID=A0A6G0NGX2_9STRA|nr:hypothetical protein PF004_g16954 [Phytophthora fragariae]